MPKHSKKYHFFTSSSSCKKKKSSSSSSSSSSSCKKKSSSIITLSCPTNSTCDSSNTYPIITCAKNAPMDFNIFIQNITYNMITSLNNSDAANLYSGDINFVQYYLITKKMRTNIKKQLYKVNLSGLSNFVIVINNSTNLLPLINFTVKVKSSGKYKINESTYKQYKKNCVKNTQVYESLDNTQKNTVSIALANVSTTLIINNSMLKQLFVVPPIVDEYTYYSFNIWITKTEHINDNVISNVIGHVASNVSSTISNKVLSEVSNLLPNVIKQSENSINFINGILSSSVNNMFSPNNNSIAIGIPVTWQYTIITV